MDPANLHNRPENTEFGLSCYCKTGRVSASTGKSLQHSLSGAIPLGVQRKPTALSPESRPGEGPAAVVDVGTWIGAALGCCSQEVDSSGHTQASLLQTVLIGVPLCAYAA